MAVVEVSYGMTEVIIGLVVPVIPVPVMTAKITPATAFVTDTSFPAGIKVAATDVNMTGRTMLYHYMGTGYYYMRAPHLMIPAAAHLHTAVMMHHHLTAVTAMTVTLIATAVVTAPATLSINVNTCHAHHGCHYHHVEIVALHNRIV
jgi:hypothetical protein